MAKGSPGLRAAIVGMAICGLFASLSLVMGMYLWGIVGIAVTGGQASRRVSTRHAGVLAPQFAGIAFVGVAVLLVVQDAAYARLQDAVDDKELAGAKKALVVATSFGVGLPGYELFASQEMAKLKAWNEADEAAELAEQRGEDRASAAYQRSILAIVNRDAAGAAASADAAIALAPNWYKPHLLKAQIFQAMGKEAESAAEARLSLTLGWKGK
jgi:hypothetical protein